jgi:hypothetical protein
MREMCEHCEILKEVLTELTGEKVAGVIMRRAEVRLHGHTNDHSLTYSLAVAV